MHQSQQPIPLGDLPLISDLALDMLDHTLHALWGRAMFARRRRSVELMIGWMRSTSRRSTWC